MGTVPPLLIFLLMVVSGWVHRRQLIVIKFLQAENRFLKKRLCGGRIRFTDAECGSETASDLRRSAASERPGQLGTWRLDTLRAHQQPIFRCKIDEADEFRLQEGLATRGELCTAG